MALYSSTAQYPLGLQVGQAERVRVIMRGGTGGKGMIVRFDMAGSDGDVTAGKVRPGDANSPTSNVLAATNSHNGPGFILAVLDEDIADDAQGWAVIRGRVQVRATGSTNPNVGVPFSVGASSRAVTLAQHARACGVTLEAGAAADGLIWVDFDGVNGLGVKSDS